MITFKQFITEGASIEELASLYAKHCSKWADVQQPLWRFSREAGAEGLARETGERLKFKGGTGVIIDWLFKQSAWAGFPDRGRSVFCSTTEKFEVGVADSDTTYAIYPYDSADMAQTEAIDFNFIKPFTGKLATSSMHHLLLFELEDSIEKPSTNEIFQKYKLLKKYPKTPAEKFGGWFEHDYKPLLDNPEIDRITKNEVKTVVDAIETRLTPEHMGCKRVSPSTIDFSEQHEVWFEGKYLMVPKPKLADFINAVNQLTK